MNPSRTYSITLMAVAGALASPCSITLHAKDPKGVLMVLYCSLSGWTRIWKYQLDRSILERYFALATVLRIMAWFGISPLSLIVISFLRIRSASSLILLLCFILGNILTRL